MAVDDRLKMWALAVGVAVWVTVLAAQVEAEPPGFVNINCGASAPFFDTALNMTWDTDEKYTSDGESAGAGDQGNATLLYTPIPTQTLATLRRFPGPRNRSCYSLPAKARTTYLVRASFLPQRPAPKFDLAVEGTRIKTVDTVKGEFVEVVMTAARDAVNVCLLRIISSLDVPYVSTLELRPLDTGMYAPLVESAYLSRLSRMNFGVDDKLEKYTRYPDDRFDRVWLHWRGDYDPVNTTRAVDVARAANQPPQAVMRTARRLIGWQDVRPMLEGVEYYIALYLAELDPSASLARVFSVDIDTVPWIVNLTIGGPFVAIQVDTTFTTVAPYSNVTFTPSVGSSDKPILNAIEIYQVFRNPAPFSPDGAVTSSGDSPGFKYLIPTVVAGAVGGVLLFVIVFIVLLRRRHQKKPDPSSFTQGKESQSFQTHTIKFTLRELRDASSDFSKKIGEGGFGPVYYGRLATGQEIAIKVSSETSKQGHAEFRNEVDLLSRVHHKNLVSLIGYCQEKQQMLIYEYLPNGTLRDHLYGPLATAPLSWITRIRIALDAAQGLEYLHIACSPNIIHRDVKSSNILLTARMEAKVSDFGLSKSAMEEGATHVSTLVKGTAGYLDPQYYTTQKLTVKSDVYSFGVVLLELICGRPPIDARLNSNIIDMARLRLQAGDVHEIVDRGLHSDYSVESMWKVAEVAMLSVEPKDSHRPNMQEVVRELRDALALEEQRCAATTTAQLPRQPHHHVKHSRTSSSSATSEIIRSDLNSSDTGSSQTSGAESGYSFGAMPQSR